MFDSLKHLYAKQILVDMAYEGFSIKYDDFTAQLIVANIKYDFVLYTFL